MSKVAPQYHAVISPVLLACLRDRANPPPAVAAPPRRVAVAAQGMHTLRRDGGRPLRLKGTFVASSRGPLVAHGAASYRPMLNLYVNADEALIAHVILEPEDADAARPVYRVVEVIDESVAERVAVEAGLLPSDPAAPASHQNSTFSEGTSHVLSNAVA